MEPVVDELTGKMEEITARNEKVCMPTTDNFLSVIILWLKLCLI